MRSTLLSRFPLEVLVLRTTDDPGRHYLDLIKSKRGFPGSPVVNTSTTGGMGSILGWGTRIPHAVQCGKKNKKKKKKKKDEKDFVV